jgi:hypothetical protein
MNKKQTPPSFDNGHGAPEAPQLKHTDKSLALILPGAGKLTGVSMELPASTTQAQWQKLGIALARLDDAKQWWIGDWWAHAEHKYGERKAIVENKDWQGPAYGTCANAATVCRAFEPSRRREVLSFSHHEYLARRARGTALSKPEIIKLADELLDWCEEPLKKGEKRPHSIAELELEIIRRENRKVFDQVVSTLDAKIRQRCKNLSKEKAKAFKDEIIAELESIMRANYKLPFGDRIRAADLEMQVEKCLNNLLGEPDVPLKLTEFIKPIREWRAHSEEELDGIVVVVPAKDAAKDLRACQLVIGELLLFMSKLTASINWPRTSSTHT